MIIPSLKHLLPLLAVLLAASAPPLRSAQAETLANHALSVTVDTAFPRVVGYRMAGVGIAGRGTPVSVVELNGKPAACRVSFRRLGAAAGEYALDFPELDVRMRLHFAVTENSLDIRATRIEETGAFKVDSVFFPENHLLTLDGPDVSIASLHATCVHDDHRGVFRERIGPLAGMKAEADAGNYFFASSGKLALGVASNHPVDVERVAWEISEQAGAKSCKVWSPAWLCRGEDGEATPLPWTRVFLTPDANGDGIADWQDAALAYRANIPKPFGSGFVRDTVGENIAMNFASGAQQPFLRILDNLKRSYLATDGLGQLVVIKGFSSEGHDSANCDYAGHWNERAGGLVDFTTLLENAGRYNARVGIHINASEAYPEARRYQPEILQRDAKGNPKPGWSWLDQAHMLDKRKDLLTGSLFAALDQMRRDLPELDFVYVDTYWENGWPAWKLARKLESLGLAFHTEGNLPLDPWTVWAHWRQQNSTIMRFLWYSDRDLFGNDPILRGGRGDDDGFMGWQNQHNFRNHVRNTFTRHLPAKYLKRFELLRWEPGKEAVFSGGVKASRVGDVVTVTQDGRKVMSWTGGGTDTKLCVPWGDEIYLWDDAGGKVSWTLPPAWAGLKTVFLHPLSDRGRGAETRVPVEQGKVTVELPPGMAHVIYQNPAPVHPDMKWGEGSPVRDPGFNDYGLAAWKPSGEVRVEADGRGDPRLLVAGSVSQELAGLRPGKTYAASVWALGSGGGWASIAVRAGGREFTNGAGRFNVRHSAPNDPRTGTNYQRLKVVFDMPADTGDATLVLSAPGGGEFDDVRIVEIKRPPEAARHWFWEDFEAVDMGYGPFTCCPGERTHLSESNPPHTADTIRGRFSLKSRDGGRVLRTLPSTLRFQPNRRYRLSCLTMGNGRLVVEDRDGPLGEMKFPGGSGSVAGEFSTGDDEDTFLALHKDGGDFIVIDDLAIDDLGPAPARTRGAAADDKNEPQMNADGN